jgi:hypothetical protein
MILALKVINMEKKRLEDMSPEWIVDFLRKNENEHIDLPEEIIQRCLETLISKGENLDHFQTALFWIRTISKEKQIELKDRALMKALEIIEEMPPSSGAAHFHFLYEYFRPFPPNLRERIERTWKRLLSSMGSRDLLFWLKELFWENESKWIGITVFKEILSRGDPELICEALTLSQAKLPSEMVKQGIEKIFASKDDVLILRILKEFNISKEQRLQQLEKILAKEDPAVAYSILINISDPPLDLQERAFEIIHKIKTEEISPLALEVIEEILGQKWIIITPEFSRKIREFDRDLPLPYGFQRINEIPVFPGGKWFIRDIEKRIVKGKEIVTGALLWRPLVRVLSEGPEAEQVILLLDLGNFKGYAYLTNPRAKTVEEAIAYGYQLDPEKFRGFLIEK